MTFRIKETATPRQIEEFLDNLIPDIEKTEKYLLRTRTERCPVHNLESPMVEIKWAFGHPYGVFKCSKGDTFKMS